MISNLSDFKEIWILWWFVAPLRDERAYCEIGFRENGAKPSAFHFVLGGGGERTRIIIKLLTRRNDRGRLTVF